MTLASAEAPLRGSTAELEVWRVRVDCSPAAVEACLRLLDAAERLRAARFRRAPDRARYVLGRASLRELLSIRLRVANERLVFGTNAFGKPMLMTPGAATHFNTSHSGDWILHAFDTRGPVGIDVEAVHAGLADVDDFAAALSPEESSLIAHLPEQERAHAVARAWVRKEAYAKAIGEGVSRSPTRIHISLDPRGRPCLAYDRNEPRTPLRWNFEDVAVDANHVACLVFSGGSEQAGVPRMAVIRDFSDLTA